MFNNVNPELRKHPSNIKGRHSDVFNIDLRQSSRTFNTLIY